MEIADYVLSNDLAAERKSAKDFLGSLIGDEKGKVFRQCRDIAIEYNTAILLVECTLEELLNTRNINPNALLGSLQAIMESGCKIRFTGSPDGTVAYLLQKAREEQEGKSKVFTPHGKKTNRTIQEQMVYVISSFEGVGGSAGQKLLDEFGSLYRIFTATLDELQGVKGINKPAMERLYKLLHEEYKSTTHNESRYTC